MKKKIFITISTICAIILILMGAVAIYFYQKVNAPAFSEKETEKIVLFIDNKNDYRNLQSQLQSFHLKDMNLFDHIVRYLKYPENIKTGKYMFDARVSYLDLIRNLRNGNQTPVNVTFNNIRLKSDLSKRIGEQLMFGPDALLNELSNPEVCYSLGFDTTTIVCLFIPNTYEMYWNIPMDQFLQRMKNEYQRFWNEERTNKAKALSLTPVEVSVLASIVEEETADKSEYPIVAGLYLNRLKRGMLLQADPTVKFAVGDVTLRRILFAHLEVDSPYNTYKHIGLPPGPIRIPSISGIDAVLNYAKHDYLYMVAKEDFSGKHNFSKNLSQHNANARKYQQALNRAGIR